MKYTITYTRTTYDEKTNKVKDEKTIKITRNADSAAKAVEKLCEQYGYECVVHLIDADTYGQEWAEVNVYKPEYGTYPSWIFTALAELVKD